MLGPSQPTEKDKMRNVDPRDSVYKQPDVSLLDDKQWAYIQKRYRISPRELEVAKLVCRGYVNGSIAKKLKVKPGTVKSHLKSIFGKTHARNKITLLLRFMEDVNNFFGESPGAASITIMGIKKTSRTTPASSDILKKG
ncbi:MAG: response regulator transcription factor [Planctomycetota bacterium]|jgi:DNA-binding CsgD family transcriptional regulator